jgi:hypothetical protein
VSSIAPNTGFLNDPGDALVFCSQVRGRIFWRVADDFGAGSRDALGNFRQVQKF